MSVTTESSGKHPLLPSDIQKEKSDQHWNEIPKRLVGLLVAFFTLMVAASVLLLIIFILGGSSEEEERVLSRARRNEKTGRPLLNKHFRKHYEHFFTWTYPVAQNDFAPGGPCELPLEKKNPCESEADPCLQCREDHAPLFFFTQINFKDYKKYNLTTVATTLTGRRGRIADGILGYLQLRKCDRIFAPFTKDRYAELCNIPEQMEECYLECAPQTKKLTELFEDREPSPQTTGNFKKA
ncbi:hypothetical protein PMAYCL1PPCAC_00844 [Pristionchus mayeri]|uniref:Uncharacterized protein n=1 Tax=Pristionchus mayeri TaxID=1317129 RepID=A0AAN5C6E4_9BILA|nr:hypothetical protein PMAYCL1PPCAC_00844 [Pristionchus mayeri]